MNLLIFKALKFCQIRCSRTEVVHSVTSPSFSEKNEMLLYLCCSRGRFLIIIGRTHSTLRRNGPLLCILGNFCPFGTGITRGPETIIITDL